MAAGPIPAPQAQSPDSQGPGPGGGFVSPAPAQTDPGQVEAMKAVIATVGQMRMLANKYPQITPEVRQINDLLAQINGKIQGSGPQAEPQAPPV